MTTDEENLMEETMSYQHREAFALMQYQSDDGASSHLIWNSRDAVTPFVVTIGGVEHRHVNWAFDQCVPSFGLIVADTDLVFITDHPSLDDLRSVMRTRVEALPQYAPPEGPERDAFIDKLAKDTMTGIGEEGTPKMVTGAEWRRRTGAPSATSRIPAGTTDRFA